MKCQSRWPRDLRRGSAAARLRGLRVRISPRGMDLWLLWVSCVSKPQQWGSLGQSNTFKPCGGGREGGKYKLMVNYVIHTGVKVKCLLQRYAESLGPLGLPGHEDEDTRILRNVGNDLPKDMTLTFQKTWIFSNIDASTSKFVLYRVLFGQWIRPIGRYGRLDMKDARVRGRGMRVLANTCKPTTWKTEKMMFE